MRLFIASFMLLLSAYSNAFEYKSFTYEIKGKTEAEVLERANQVVPSIQNVTNKKVRKELSMAGCSPLKSSYIEIEGLSITKTYKYKNGDFVKEFIGRILYWHSSCTEGGF